MDVLFHIQRSRFPIAHDMNSNHNLLAGWEKRIVYIRGYASNLEIFGDEFQVGLWMVPFKKQCVIRNGSYIIYMAN